METAANKALNHHSLIQMETAANKALNHTLTHTDGTFAAANKALNHHPLIPTLLIQMETYKWNIQVETYKWNLFKSVKNSDFVVGLFLDVTKAFDTIYFSILYRKLELSGRRGLAFDAVGVVLHLFKKNIRKL